MRAATDDQREGPPDAGATYRGRAVRALGHAFGFEVSHHGLGRYLDGLFAEFDDAVGEVGRYRLTIDVDGGSSLVYDDQVVVSRTSPDHVVAMMLWHVNREVVRRSDDLVLLHAAAAARHGRAVILPAPMEAGKTTLVAGLVAAGLDYLSDEVVAVEDAAERVLAYPKALSIDPGSWDVLRDLRPTPDPEVEPLLPHQWQVTPASIRDGAAVRDAAVGCVVLPRYEAGGETRVERLSWPDALGALSTCTFDFDARPERSMRVLTRIASSVPCYRLTSGDLTTACQTVARLLAHD